MSLHARISADAPSLQPAAVAQPRGRTKPDNAAAQWAPFIALPQFVPAWRELASRALEQNVFYDPAFALPAAQVFGRQAGAVIVRSAQSGRLIGLFPARVERHRYGLGPAVLAGWTHPYAPLGVPLVDRDEAGVAIAAWLDFVSAGPGLPKLLLLPYLPSDGPFAKQLAAALAARGGRCAFFGQHARALLAPGNVREDYLAHAVSAGKRKELRRQRRRLDEPGQTFIDIAHTPASLEPALDAFMALESRGWKAGTAVARDPTLQTFMRDALLALGAESRARIARLMRGETTLAAAIVLRSGASGWFWKIAYDEMEAKNSPGVQLTLEMTRALLADLSLTHVDSCATPDHSMIDHLWRERLQIADCLIAPAPAASFTVACALEHARRAAIAAAKNIRARLRSR